MLNPRAQNIVHVSMLHAFSFNLGVRKFVTSLAGCYEGLLSFPFQRQDIHLSTENMFCPYFHQPIWIFPESFFIILTLRPVVLPLLNFLMPMFVHSSFWLLHNSTSPSHYRTMFCQRQLPSKHHPITDWLSKVALCHSDALLLWCSTFTSLGYLSMLRCRHASVLWLRDSVPPSLNCSILLSLPVFFRFVTPQLNCSFSPAYQYFVNSFLGLFGYL